MPTTLRVQDRRAYDTVLADTITAKVLQRKRMLFLDCANHISQYMFHEQDLKFLLDNLFIARIERIYELIDQLETLESNQHFKTCQTLLISPYQDILEQEATKEDEQRRIQGRIEQLTHRIEELGKEVLLLEVRHGWDTRSPLNDTSSMES